MNVQLQISSTFSALWYGYPFSAHLIFGMEDFNDLECCYSECTVANQSSASWFYYRTCASRMAHRLRQTKSLASLPKNRALPRSSNTSNNNSSSSRPSSRPLQSLSKTSPGWVLTGCNFNEVRTRCKRGPKTKIWETDPLSLLTNSLVATRFRILFRTVRLKSFQLWSRRGNQAKLQLQARARREKRRQRASKGDRGETEGRQRGDRGETKGRKLGNQVYNCHDFHLWEYSG